MTATDTSTYYTVINAIDTASANYSRYAEKPVGGYARMPGQYHSPLDYGIPATGDLIAKLHPRNRLGGFYDLPLRRKVKAVVRELDKEIARIEEYRAFLAERITHHNERVRRGIEGMPDGAILRLDRSAQVAWVFLDDLNLSKRILTEGVIPFCPTK